MQSIFREILFVTYCDCLWQKNSILPLPSTTDSMPLAHDTFLFRDVSRSLNNFMSFMMWHVQSLSIKSSKWETSSQLSDAWKENPSVSLGSVVKLPSFRFVKNLYEVSFLITFLKRFRLCFGTRTSLVTFLAPLITNDRNSYRPTLRLLIT